MPRRQRSTIAGRVDVTAMLLRDRRVTIRTYVPADYEWTDRDYRVVYMFDGHNLFDRTTSTYDKEWRIDEYMQTLGSGGCEPAIVVGIDAPQNRYERFAMYTISDWEYRKRPDSRLLQRIRGFGAGDRGVPDAAGSSPTSRGPIGPAPTGSGWASRARPWAATCRCTPRPATPTWCRR